MYENWESELINWWCGRRTEFFVKTGIAQRKMYFFSNFKISLLTSFNGHDPAGSINRKNLVALHTLPFTFTYFGSVGKRSMKKCPQKFQTVMFCEGWKSVKWWGQNWCLWQWCWKNLWKSVQVQIFDENDNYVQMRSRWKIKTTYKKTKVTTYLPISY